MEIAHIIYAFPGLHQNEARDLKGGYLDFLHLTELKNIYVTEIYMKKHHISSIIKNHKIRRKYIFDGVPLKG